MKVTTRTDTIRVIIELSEVEALALASALTSLRPVLGSSRIGWDYSRLSRDINDAVTQARAPHA